MKKQKNKGTIYSRRLSPDHQDSACIWKGATVFHKQIPK